MIYIRSCSSNREIKISRATDPYLLTELTASLSPPRLKYGSKPALLPERGQSTLPDTVDVDLQSPVILFQGYTMEMRAAIRASIDKVGEVEQAESWLEENRTALSYMSDMTGCNCTRSWDVEGPKHVLDTLPSHLRAVATADAAMPGQTVCAGQCRPAARRQCDAGMHNGNIANGVAVSAAVSSYARSDTSKLVGILYLLSAALTVRLAVSAYTPCASNFEGGCSMAKGLVAVFSLLPAIWAFILAIVLITKRTTSTTTAGNARIATRAAHMLWVIPLAYVLFMLHALF